MTPLAFGILYEVLCVGVGIVVGIAIGRWSKKKEDI